MEIGYLLKVHIDMWFAVCIQLNTTYVCYTLVTTLVRIFSMTHTD